MPTSRVLRLRRGQSRPKVGCEHKGFIYGKALNKACPGPASRVPRDRNFKFFRTPALGRRLVQKSDSICSYPAGSDKVRVWRSSCMELGLAGEQ